MVGFEVGLWFIVDFMAVATLRLGRDMYVYVRMLKK